MLIINHVPTDVMKSLYKTVWTLNASPKVKQFCWRILHNNLPCLAGVEEAWIKLVWDVVKAMKILIIDVSMQSIKRSLGTFSSSHSIR